LDFLGYYGHVGWKNAKGIDFGSSIRFELLQNVGNEDDFRIRVIYDEDIIELTFC
jgi:hypothetical protein